MQLLTGDRWNSEKAYVDYLEKHKDKYDELDNRFAALTESETKIGSFRFEIRDSKFEIEKIMARQALL